MVNFSSLLGLLAQKVATDVSFALILARCSICKQQEQYIPEIYLFLTNFVGDRNCIPIAIPFDPYFTHNFLLKQQKLVYMLKQKKKFKKEAMLPHISRHYFKRT